MEYQKEVQNSDFSTSMFSNLKQEEVAIVMVPFPGQGHLNQLLQLACLISSTYDLPVYYVGAATHNLQARVRANALDPSDIAKIHFHDIPTPEFASPPPDFNALSKFPSHLEPSWDACMLLREPIGSFLRDISSKSRRVVVVHDSLMSYNVQDVSSLHNAESYIFNCISVFTLYCLICFSVGIPVQLEEELLKKLPSLEGIMTDKIRDRGASQSPYVDVRSGYIHNTSKVIEGKFLDLLAQVGGTQNKKQWAIGPILPTKLNHVSNRNDICLDWLNKQPPRSVLYVSFGTTTSFSYREIKELAMGLEQSKQRFIWVLRDADRGDIFTGEARKVELPDGFEERVKGVGLVVRDWAPQPEILSHSSTGGFMSHCGWNSCIESITMGVPMAAWPMHSDQPKNGFLVTEMLKIGLIVREWEKRDLLVSASTIENVVRKLMATEEGDVIRKRAKELGEAICLKCQILNATPRLPGTEHYEDIPSIKDCFSFEFWEYMKKEVVPFFGKISSGELFNSSRVIESLHLDLMAKEFNDTKLWAIGPFNPLVLTETEKGSNKHHESLDWLDKQEPRSVIFVSFGTTISLCDEEIEEIALGLEKSQQKFIWVLRDVDKGNVFASEVKKIHLPEGYEERIKGGGIIVRDWAPQLEILAHSSTGGFMSHCGWNSCMESMSFGVPIAAWPMHSDQPRNAQLVTKYLKIGLTVRPWARRDEGVTSEMVENAVRTLMASPEGAEMRKRAADLRYATKKSVMEGGINRAEMDSFIAHITR
ncbi:zeatin O-xylosyltransferase-like [Lycium ferocissimum]|uniref:zeatin O-xylosyltransferase-like n=1 Tax=Lycium ferocissimum TaxID=112874 RepID=UPI002815035E|nr:zeatin O-xylosyltransferase-like [Lycium ferocissimum]